MIPIEDILNAKNITLKANNDSFSNACAIYTYILILHKKVTLVKDGEIDTNLSFLPWYDKVRETIPASTDLVLEISEDTLSYINFCKNNEIKINKKMATSFYAGLLQRYENFQNTHVDGTVFALASELIELQAEHVLCHDFLVKRVPLCVFRLKALLFKKMLLLDEASVVHLLIDDEDLEKSGANIKDTSVIMREVLTLVNVKKVVLIKTDENNRIIKEEIKFEK
jgi:phosphoesterase RecJ-like protein